MNEAERGLLPAEATIVVGQPLAVDPSRAPEGKWILWIQLQELPRRPKGDAAGEIDTGTAPGRTSSASATPTGSRPGIARHVPNLESALLRRVVLSPADIERANVNLVGGDIYCGLVRARPEPRLATESRRCRAIARRSTASTTSARAPIPGPGLGAGSGTIVAQELLRGNRPRRALSASAATWALTESL